MRRLLTWALGSWAVWRLLGPESQPRFSPGQRRPLRVPGRTVFVGEREFFVRQAGSETAPVIVLVHGWGFDGEMTYHRIIEPLAENFRVVVPDHRNHGKSDWVRGRFDIADLADEVAGVLDAIDVSRATFVGYSLGGLVVQEMARRHPGKVDRMILGATAAQPVHRMRPLARGGMWLARSLARFSHHEIASVSTRVTLRAGAIAPEHQRWLRAALLRRDPSLFYEAGHAAWRFDSRAWVKRLPQPSMVVITGRDRIVETAAQRELVEVMEPTETVELPAAGHESILTDSQQWVDLIKRFAG